MASLRDAVLALDEDSWRDQQYRQETCEVHRQTESLVLVFTDGSGWPDIEVCQETAWDWFADAAVPLMHSIIERHYPKGGQACEINNQLIHSVMNKGAEDRITCIFDYLPPARAR